MNRQQVIANATKILKRNDTPEFSEYRLRRKQAQYELKYYLKHGNMFYDNSEHMIVGLGIIKLLPYVRVKRKKK